ncbi:MAG: hypothetical protein RLZZ299_3134 [Pseudomonadota bacterium]|jgi:hypothetical protein
MVMLASLPSLAFALLACSGDGKGTDSGTSDVTDTASGTPSADDVAELDLSDTLQADAEGCQDHNDIVVTGAAGYFVDVLVLQDRTAGARTWQGTERWILYANDAWKATGNDDCVITWALEGTEAARGACSTCAYGIDVVATLDSARSTCPLELVEGDERMTFTYAVDARADHSASVYFAGSGNAVSERAVWNDAGLGLATARSCKWF